MPGPTIANPIPDWMKPENASVTDSAITKALRMIGHLIGADNPTSQVLGLMMTDVPSTGPGGGLVGALNRLVEKGKAIRAFHGSPHDFEQFDISKIGTGEGAQAYGHGLYFAENPETAAQYRKILSNPRVEVGGKIVDAGGDRATDIALAHIETAAQESADRAETFLKARKSISQMQYNATPEMRPIFSAARERIAELEAKGATVGQGGKTYEVAIHADPESFLDWDKPLSQQSPYVQEAVASARNARDVRPVKMSDGRYSVTAIQPDGSGKLVWDIRSKSADEALESYRSYVANDSGESVYREMSKGFSPHSERVTAAEQLKQSGIPGIKYLDQGSRTAGEGTRNYVVFDDSLVSILKKYGILLPAAGVGAAQAKAPQ